MDRTASPQVLANWRFQQAQYRAHYDAYTRARLLYETELENRAMAQLRAARGTGSLAAMTRAEEMLDRAATERAMPDWRARVFELAEALFQSIRMQLSVPWYKAISVDRGANLDTIDVPLNNRMWLKARFAELRQTSDEAERLKGIDAIVNWTDPGPGGFYDDLGQSDAAAAPGARRGVSRRTRRFWNRRWSGSRTGRRSAAPGGRTPSRWWTRRCRCTTTISIRDAQYKIRVVYGGDSPDTKIRLAGERRRGASAHGEAGAGAAGGVRYSQAGHGERRAGLDAGIARPGLGGNGRGCQVSEVWLIRK